MNSSTHINASDVPLCPYSAVSTFFTAALSVISLAGLIGNIFVIVAVYETAVLRTSTNYYYVNMAVSDLLCCLVTWPVYITDKIITSHGSIIQDALATTLCKIGVFLRMITYSVSNVTLVLIAVDRFIATAFPLKATLLTRKLRLILISTTWLITIPSGIPNLYFATVENVGEISDCELVVGDHVTVVIYFLTGIGLTTIAPLITIIILYSRIMRVLKRKHIQESGTESNSTDQKRRKQSQNILNIFISIVVGYFVCWLIMCFTLFIEIISPKLLIKDTCHWVLGFAYYVFPSLSTLINPVILFSFSSNFRNAFHSLCPCPRGPCFVRKYRIGHASNKGLTATLNMPVHIASLKEAENGV